MQTDCFPDATGTWPKGPVSNLAVVSPRYPMMKGREYPFVEMASVGENFAGILQFGTRTLEGSGLSRFKIGDTLFAKITPCPQNGKVAFVDSIPGDLGLGSTEFIVLSPRAGTVPRFLFHLACSHDVRGRAAARMEGSTGRQRVPDEVFTKRLLVPLPDPDEQAAIARILDAWTRRWGAPARRSTGRGRSSVRSYNASFLRA
jgi:type I restriction enzyme S subunit